MWIDNFYQCCFYKLFNVDHNSWWKPWANTYSSVLKHSILLLKEFTNVGWQFKYDKIKTDCSQLEEALWNPFIRAIPYLDYTYSSLNILRPFPAISLTILGLKSNSESLQNKFLICIIRLQVTTCFKINKSTHHPKCLVLIIILVANIFMYISLAN